MKKTYQCLAIIDGKLVIVATFTAFGIIDALEKMVPGTTLYQGE